MESTISLVIVLSMIGILFICLHALSDESTPSDLQLGRVIRKPVLCIYMRKQRLSNCAAEQLVVFATKIVQSYYLLNPLSIFCGCAAQFVTDLVRNPVDKLSRDAAQIASS